MMLADYADFECYWNGLPIFWREKVILRDLIDRGTTTRLRLIEQLWPDGGDAPLSAFTNKSGMAKGERAKVLDYSTDNGKNWVNHGIYCRHMIKKAETMQGYLVGTSIMSSRVNQVFPVDCHY